MKPIMLLSPVWAAFLGRGAHGCLVGAVGPGAFAIDGAGDVLRTKDLGEIAINGAVKWFPRRRQPIIHLRARLFDLRFVRY